MDMVINAKNALRNEGERFDFDLTAQMEPMNYMGNVRFGDVRLNGYYFFDGSSIRVNGRVEVTCVFECDRCLKEFEKKYDLAFDERYSFDAEEENFRISKNETFDIQPLLNDTVISSLPIERLCKEDCKGLCPHCGIDKNFSSCPCEDVKRDNPFSKLAGLVD